MKTTVWILNHHANNMFFDNGGRHYAFAKYLKQKGYNPVIFCSNAEHGTCKLCFEMDEIWEEHINEQIDVPFVFVKGRPYIGNGKNRILCMIDYFLNVKKATREYAKLHGKPDIIIGSQVHPLAVLAAEQLAKEFGVKVIAEFRDLWPESIVAMGLASKNNPIVVALRILEKHLYKNADSIIFTVEGGYDYILERHWEKTIPQNKVHYINNGVDLEAYKQNISNSEYHDDELEDEEIFKIVYAGSIRQANGLDELIDSAIELRNNEKVKFLIYGDGDYKDKLIEKVNENKLTNVSFKGKIPKKDVPFILSKSNLNLLNYNAKAAEGFYRFGSSQNKLFEYLASGKPILSNFKANYDIIEKNHCGIARTISTNQEYAEAIKEILSMTEKDYNAICKNASTVVRNFDFAVLTDNIVSIIENL